VSNTANAIAGLTVQSSGTNALAITGKPTATGTETFTVTATDAAGATTSTDYSITVADAPTTSGIHQRLRGQERRPGHPGFWRQVSPTRALPTSQVELATSMGPPST